MFEWVSVLLVLSVGGGMEDMKYGLKSDGKEARRVPDASTKMYAGWHSNHSVQLGRIEVRARFHWFSTRRIIRICLLLGFF